MLHRTKILVMVASTLLVVDAAGCATGGNQSKPEGSAGSGAGQVPRDCPAGETLCDGDVLISCDDSGAVASQQDCGASGEQCTLFGCRTCTPSGQTCENGIARQCDENGESFVELECDALQGLTCAPDGCTGACAPGELPRGNVGCDFWPTITRNGVLRDWFEFAVVVANTSDEPANIAVHRGALAIAGDTVPAQSAQVIELPWVPQLKGPDSTHTGIPFPPEASVHVAAGSYRLRSDRPVSVYQFSALRYSDPQGEATGCPIFNGGCFSYSNDASILLPSHALTSNYVVGGFEMSGENETMQPFVAITATQDDTDVEVIASQPLMAGDSIAALNAGESNTFKMQRGDVLQLFSSGSSARGLSGTRITSSVGKPVQVVSGVPSTAIPSDSCCGDHIEEVVIPVETLGSSYLITTPSTPQPGSSPDSELALVRIHGVFDNTALSFDPAVAPQTTLDAGETIEVSLNTQHVAITADQPFAVTQYMLSSNEAGAGDPSQTVAIPREQFRDHYVFVAPADYDRNRVNVIAEMGSTITLDGNTISPTDFSPIASSGMAVARVDLDGSDIHTIDGDTPFGILVYGFGAYTSYMYPGGMLLEPISEPPPK